MTPPPQPLRDRAPRRPPRRSSSATTSRFCLIGERINPTGRRIFQEQLRAGDLSAIERDVKAQVEGGADVLDVNMGVPLTDEPELLAKAIRWSRRSPTCRSASTPRSSRRSRPGSSVYQGRALVNSITAEDDRMAAILPLVKKYDAAIIALPNDHDEIPMEADKRLDLTGEDHPRRHRGVRHRRRPTSSSTRWPCRSAPTPATSLVDPGDDAPDPRRASAST